MRVICCKCNLIALNTLRFDLIYSSDYMYHITKSYHNRVREQADTVFASNITHLKLVRAILIRNHHKVNMLATEGYCVKCKAKRAMKGEQQVVMKNGRPATKGTCSVCGTKMFKIGGGPSKMVKKAKPKSKSKAKPKRR